MKVKIFIICLSLVIIIMVAFYQLLIYQDGKLHVVFCNIGQGDAIYIKTPDGRDILIDAGPDNSVLECLGTHMPFWDKTIELAFATHPDADHIGGYSYVLNSYTILSYNTSEKKAETGVYLRIQELLSEKRIPVKHLTTGDTYILGNGLRLKTLWPTKEFIVSDFSDDTNPHSLVQMLNFNKFDLLLDGDIRFDTLNEILKQVQHDSVVIDVFKLPHHGSRTGIDPSTFNIIHPLLSIISAGKNNRYGHPHFTVTDELKKHGLKYLETMNGGIEIVSDGEGFIVKQ